MECELSEVKMEGKVKDRPGELRSHANELDIVLLVEENHQVIKCLG